MSARRAREINSYYHSLGEGLGQYTPPLVDSSSNKPLSIALEEIAAGKVVVQRPGDALRVAEELLGTRAEDDEAADVVSLGLAEDAEDTTAQPGVDSAADDVAEGDAGDES